MDKYSGILHLGQNLLLASVFSGFKYIWKNVDVIKLHVKCQFSMEKKKIALTLTNNVYLAEF